MKNIEKKPNVVKNQNNDYDEKGTIFCSDRYGYVIVDDKRKGKKTKVPNKECFVFFECKKLTIKKDLRNNPVEVELTSYFISHSKILTTWLKKHSRFNIDFGLKRCDIKREKENITPTYYNTILEKGEHIESYSFNKEKNKILNNDENYLLKVSDGLKKVNELIEKAEKRIEEEKKTLSYPIFSVNDIHGIFNIIKTFPFSKNLSEDISDKLYDELNKNILITIEGELSKMYYLKDKLLSRYKYNTELRKIFDDVIDL